MHNNQPRSLNPLVIQNGRSLATQDEALCTAIRQKIGPLPRVFVVSNIKYKMVNQGQFEVEAQLVHEQINLSVKWLIGELKHVHKTGALLRILWINPKGVGLEMVAEAAS
ncbi:MAG: hypothetical protein CTY12_06585 [Methylotenera sp.]|nr:MAG: hypothetical protein CTY12_06585 [Methylotenera sp.]